MEHVVALALRAERGGDGKVYHLETEVLETRGGSVWEVLPTHEMAVLDFEAVEPISESLATSYGAAVREALR